MNTYLLYEIAGSHGGSEEYVHKLIDALPREKNTGIKFQVFKYDQIALKDYQWYKVYTELFFDKEMWSKIMHYVKNKGFDIWIDVFDLYSVEIIKNNTAPVASPKSIKNDGSNG